MPTDPELTQGFRVPADVLAYASRLLPTIAPDLALPTSVRTGAGSLQVRRCEPFAEGADTGRGLAEEPGTTGVIVESATSGDHLTGLRHLYACLTRAVSRLVVLHARELPDELVQDRAPARG